MEKNFIEQRRVCQKNYLLLTVDFLGGQKEMFSKVMKYLLNFHYRCLWQYSGTSLYILLRKKNSSFFFFFS